MTLFDRAMSLFDRYDSAKWEPFELVVALITKSCCYILRMNTEHITASLADESNYAYCQSRNTHNIKHI